MIVTTKKWDASEHLDSPEMIQAYLNASFKGGDNAQILQAIGNVARAQGMSNIAEKTDLGRQNLYKALSSGSSPKFDTVKKVIEAMGCQLVVVAQ